MSKNIKSVAKNFVMLAFAMETCSRKKLRMGREIKMKKNH